ncbi:MAG: hypothetical protein HYS32_04455 [Candidatus Woesearchaeota archaeon]|nr:MAG: hypothetical protein HYS32_04455 [Candidatus Woesearchaeota archaeon]
MAKKEQKNKKQDIFSEEKLLLDLPPEFLEKIKQAKKVLTEFQEKALKEMDKVIAIGILPPPKPREGQKEPFEKISILALINDQEEKNKNLLLDKVLKQGDKLAKEIDEKLIDPQPMLLSELKQACFDQKYDIINLIAMGAPTYDPKDILKALKISEIHKSMVLKKFDKYIVSYIAMGSLFRGDATSHDIDVTVIVDDTDVKKMSRIELRDKLGSLIRSYGYTAEEMTGIKKLFHVQVYILTDFWDAVKDAHPVMFTILRDGVPLYDRGVFMPWKSLLEMGRIKPSQEATESFFDTGKKLITRGKNRLVSVAAEDIYLAVLNPAQAALMLYGIAPPTPKETIQLMEDIFVKRDKLLEQKYVDILANVVKTFKDIEHFKIKYIKGVEVDKLMDDAEDFLKRIDKLFKQIQEKREKESLIDFYDDAIKITRDVLTLEKVEKVPSDDLVKTVKEKLVSPGLISEKQLRNLNSLLKAKEDYEKNKLTRQEVEKVRKSTQDYIKSLTEHMQFKRGKELERTKLQVKYGDKYGEVLLLDDVAFIIKDIDAKEKDLEKAKITKEGGLENIEKATYEELESHIKDIKMPKHVFLKEKIFEDLKKVFGKDVEVLVNW